MNRPAFRFLLVLLLCTSVARADGPPQARKTRGEVLSYLAGLPGLPSKKILSGQRIGYIDGSGEDRGTKTFDDISAITGGVLPAIMAFDIAMKDRSRGSYDLSPVIAHWNAGGLVHAVWHAPNPANGNVWKWPLNSPTLDLRDVYTPGNATYDNFRTQLTKVRDAFSALQDHGVVVLFAPFHEANNHNDLPSFWWDGKAASVYRALWVYVHDYLTRERNLGNILWVYAATIYYDVAEYYPGDGYVDIVGLDYHSWNNRFDSPAAVSNYNDLLVYGKPFAVTELSQCGSETSCGGADARVLLDDLAAIFPNAVYWYNWDDTKMLRGLGNQTHVKELLADERVVVLSDNPSGAGRGAAVRETGQRPDPRPPASEGDAPPREPLQK